MSATRSRSKQSLRVWLRLLACENVIEHTVRTHLRETFNVTLPQFDVLSELEHAGDPLTMSQLSEKLMVSNGNVTGVVDRLERNGYVKRQPSSTDRRVWYLSLTEKGTTAFDQMAEVHEAWVSDLLSRVSTSELDQLLTLLDKIRKSAEAQSSQEQTK